MSDREESGASGAGATGITAEDASGTKATMAVRERDLADSRTNLAVGTCMDILNRRGYRVKSIAGVPDEEIERLNTYYFDFMRARPGEFVTTNKVAPVPPLSDKDTIDQLKKHIVGRGKNDPVNPILVAVLEDRETVEARDEACMERLKAIADSEIEDPHITARRASIYLREMVRERDWPALRTEGNESNSIAWVVVVRGKKLDSFNKEKTIRVNYACYKAGVARVLVLTDYMPSSNSVRRLHRRLNHVCGESHLILKLQKQILRSKDNNYGDDFTVLDTDATRKEVGGDPFESLPLTYTTDKCIGKYLGCRHGMFVQVMGETTVVINKPGGNLDSPEDNVDEPVEEPKKRGRKKGSNKKKGKKFVDEEVGDSEEETEETHDLPESEGEDGSDSDSSIEIMPEQTTTRSKHITLS